MCSIHSLQFYCYEFDKTPMPGVNFIACNTFSVHTVYVSIYHESYHFSNMLFQLVSLNIEFPEIVINPQNSSIPAGGVARFNCSATGFPLPDIMWMKDGVAISQLNDNRFSTEMTTFMDELLSVSVLTLDRPDLTDNGLYSCNASNQLRLFDVTTSESAELFVLCKEICTHVMLHLKSMHTVCK